MRASAGRVCEGRPRRAPAARAHYLQVAHPDLTFNVITLLKLSYLTM